MGRYAALLACALLAAAPGVHAATRAPALFIAPIDEDSKGAPTDAAHDRVVGDRGGWRYHLRPPLVTDDQLTGAYDTMRSLDNQMPVVVLAFTPAGVTSLEAYARQHPQGRVAIVVNGHVERAAPIEMPYGDGQVAFQPWESSAWSSRRLAWQIGLIIQAHGRRNSAGARAGPFPPWLPS